MRGSAPSVYYALGDPLVVEVGDLLAKYEVFEQGRAPGTRFQAVLVVVDGDGLIGGETRRRPVLAECVECVDLLARGWFAVAPSPFCCAACHWPRFRSP
jgi:hypothetical protein